ncbi:hypothetical protein [Porphyromonas pogonae]|uniref:NigD1/NigD2 family lipoprotein n=1 Tax=Porphyromonas pogonae TaxID=867595 RepID=UPI002E79911A|nr:NigD-like C-terminal domain-containing protein [Porphyromonas pogonae]
MQSKRITWSASHFLEILLIIFGGIAWTILMPSCNKDELALIGSGENHIFSAICTAVKSDLGQIEFVQNNNNVFVPQNTESNLLRSVNNHQRYIIEFRPVKEYERPKRVTIELLNIYPITTKDIDIIDEENAGRFGDDPIAPASNYGNYAPVSASHDFIDIKFVTAKTTESQLVSLCYDPKLDNDSNYLTLELRFKADYGNINGIDPLNNFIISFKTDKIKEKLNGKKGIRLYTLKKLDDKQKSYIHVNF